MAKKKDNNKKRINPWWVWVLAIVICFGVWYGGAHWTRSYAQKHADDNTERVGQFGDSFGAVNALVSALAFAGVIASLWLQRKEYEAQRDDLKLQYDESKLRREESRQQNQTLKLQRFENTFFNMMQLQQQIVNDLHLEVPVSLGRRGNLASASSMPIMRVINGREVIQYIYKKVKTIIEVQGLNGYADVEHRDLLDHYFRHLYTILRYVDESKAFEVDGKLDEQREWEQKYQYTKIVRATLSRYEMLMLYYNGLSEFGREKLKPLMEKYAMLDNLDKYQLAASREFKSSLGFDPIAENSNSWMRNLGLTGTDYEYFLTEQEGDMARYHISAFGRGEREVQNAKQSLEFYKKMIEERNKIL